MSENRKTDTTRYAIMDAAGDLFSRLGYRGASLRAIAGEAGCDPALIRHYFASKEALYQAVIVEATRPAEALREALTDRGPRAAERLLRKAAADWDDPAQLRRILGVLRSAADLPTAAARLRAALIPPGAAVEEGDELRLALIGSLFIGVVMARHMDLLSSEFLSEQDQDALVRSLAPAVEAHLTHGRPADTP